MATAAPPRDAPQQYGDVSEKGVRLVMVVARVMAASSMQTLGSRFDNHQRRASKHTRQCRPTSRRRVAPLKILPWTVSSRQK